MDIKFKSKFKKTLKELTELDAFYEYEAKATIIRIINIIIRGGALTHSDCVILAKQMSELIQYFYMADTVDYSFITKLCDFNNEVNNKIRSKYI